MNNKISITDISPDGTLSVKTEITSADGEQIIHREALTPGNFVRAREILSDELYQQVCDLWTPELVQMWAVTAEEQPTPPQSELTPEQRIAQLEAMDAAKQQQIDDLSILVLQLGGALIG